MIGLEQWRAAIGGWYSGNISAIYRRYGSRRIVRNWPRLLLIMDGYTATAYYAVYWLFVVLLAFISADNLPAALTLAFDDTCGYQHSLRALIKSPIAAVFDFSQDSLQRFWVFASPTAVPVLKLCTVCLQRLCKLATSPSASSTLRLLAALQWLLIVAGDVELNPGPIPQGIAELLPTVDDSILTEDDAFDLLEEVGSLAARWRSICLALGLKLSDAETIASTWRDNPKKCMRAMLEEWLKKCYNTQKHGLPTWQKLVGAVANDNGGNDPALAETIAKNHQHYCDPSAAMAEPAKKRPKLQGTDPRSQRTRTDPYSHSAGTGPCTQSAIDLFAKYLRSKYKTGISKFLSLQWPPPPTQKVLNLAMILEKKIRYGSSDEIIRHTQHGRINDVLYAKQSIKLEEIFQRDTAERKVVLIKGAPGSGKSTLSWYICKQWQSGNLFQEFHTVMLVQLRDPAMHSATTLEQMLPATRKIQTAAVVEELQAGEGRGMLWILDGWDELPLRLRTDCIFHKLIEDPAELDLDCSTILITSRPVASGDLYRSITSRIEILGFTPTEVKEYFTEALGGDLQSVDRLQNYLKEQPVIEASCYIPLTAAIVTHLFKAQDQSLPTTLHEVFTSLIIGCLIRHNKTIESEECRISSLDSLPSCLKEPFDKICALAYYQVVENKATFSEEDLKQVGLPKHLNTLGLIQGIESFTSLQKSVSYNFLHLSVQELLASFFISKLPESEQMEVFKKLFGQPRFTAVFRFYAAFTKLKAVGIRDIVADIVKKKDVPELLYLIHGLYEARDVPLCQFVISQLGRRLDLSRNSLSPEDCLSIGYFLCRVFHTVEEEFVVSLRWCSLDYNRVRFLVKEFSKSGSAGKTTTADARMPNYTKLHLHLVGNAIGGEGADLLCTALNANSSLQTLNLSYNSIGLAGLKAIAKLVEQSEILEHLNLSDTDVGDEGVPILCRALNVNKSLKNLKLGYNEIKHSAGTIAEVLQQNKTLEDLDLSGNGITAEGAAALGVALNNNSTLKALNLYRNSVGDEGATHLCEALKANNALKTLHLGLNKVSDDGAQALGAALKENQSLRQLNLDYNNISDAGAKALQDALRVNQDLTKLWLFENAGMSRDMEVSLCKDFPRRVDI